MYGPFRLSGCCEFGAGTGTAATGYGPNSPPEFVVAEVVVGTTGAGDGEVPNKPNKSFEVSVAGAGIGVGAGVGAGAANGCCEVE